MSQQNILVDYQSLCLVYAQLLSVMSSKRGLRLAKALREYNASYKRWDSQQVLQKIEITELNDGVLRASFSVSEDMCNSLLALQGGFMSSLVDVCSLYAYFSHPDGRISWTTNLNMQYIRPAFLGDKITVDTTPLYLNKKQAILDSVLRNKKSRKIIARGTTNMQIAKEEHQDMVQKAIPFDAKLQD